MEPVVNIASVPSVIDRGLLARPSAVSQSGGKVEHMSGLLRRYPRIADPERRQLLAFLTSGPPEEVVQVVHLQGLESQVRAFRADHPREFRTGVRGWLPMIIFVLIALAALAWRLFA